MPTFLSTTIQAHIAWFDSDHDAWKFLVLQRAADQKLYPLLWQSITGTIEPPETALQTAWREIYEETGMQPDAIWVLPFVGHFYSAHNDTLHAVPCFAAIVHTADIRLSSEHCEYAWLDEDEAYKRIAMPSQREVLHVFVHDILGPLTAGTPLPFQSFTKEA